MLITCFFISSIAWVIASAFHKDEKRFLCAIIGLVFGSGGNILMCKEKPNEANEKIDRIESRLAEQGAKKGASTK